MPSQEFKETELGALPVEWKVATIGDLFAIQQGASLSPKRRKGDSPRPFLRTANVFWGHLDLSVIDSMDFTGAEAEKLALRPHDLLVCEGGAIGRTAMWRGEMEDCCYQNHLHRLRAKDSNVESEFYMYWMQAALTLLDLYKGEGNKTTIPNLSQSRLKSFSIPLPSLFEQRAIASALSMIRRAIETQDNLVGAARELKKSLMRQLLTQGLDANGQVKETELGVIPEHWKVTAFGDVVVFFQYGTSERCDADESGLPVLRIPNVIDGKVDLSDLKFLKASQQVVNKLELATGDVLFVRTNGQRHYVGRCAVFHEELPTTLFASYLIRARLDGDIASPDFIQLYTASSRGREFFLNNASGAADGKYNINTQILRRMPIPLPPVSEQREIAHILATADKKIENEEKRKAALEALFKTLLQQLMTGQIRVTDSSS